jgi:molybdenum cofactor sulfurtransferase
MMISIRSGYFCNPGIDEINNHITDSEMSGYFLSEKSVDYYDMVTHLGKMRGAIRVSVGIGTNTKDLDRFIQFAKAVEI